MSEISIDAIEPMTPVGNVVTDDEDGTPKLQLPPKDNDGVVLAQLAVNPPPAPVSKTSMVTVDVVDP